MTAGPDTEGHDPARPEAGSEPGTTSAFEPDTSSASTPSPRPVELVLARAHLRLGSLGLARAELEILDGEGGLDMPGQVDLAEARWRTGDLTGAGAAASIALGAGEDVPVALAIAAETAAALGRPNEARRLANQAMEHVTGSIDALFAGMPRSGVWPADADEPPPTAGTLFHREPAPTVDRRAGDVDPAPSTARATTSDGQPGGPAVPPLTLGFWDGDRGTAAPSTELPDPADELDAARAALIAGSIEEATLRFALVLRLAPALAPAIIEATDGVPGPAIDVVRGDAYRLVGLESEARRAYAAAAWSGSRDRRSKPHDRSIPTGHDRRAVAAARTATPDAAPVAAPDDEPAPPGA